jgi:hypothetical protein
MLLFVVVDQTANVEPPNDVAPSDEVLGLNRKKTLATNQTLESLEIQTKKP